MFFVKAIQSCPRKSWMLKKRNSQERNNGKSIFSKSQKGDRIGKDKDFQFDRTHRANDAVSRKECFLLAWQLSPRC
jgi:ribosomal protein L2